jgi:hypothetical protein
VKEGPGSEIEVLYELVSWIELRFVADALIWKVICAPTAWALAGELQSWLNFAPKAEAIEDGVEYCP